MHIQHMNVSLDSSGCMGQGFNSGSGVLNISGDNAGIGVAAMKLAKNCIQSNMYLGTG